jgi:hypothetical protein
MGIEVPELRHAALDREEESPGVVAVLKTGFSTSTAASTRKQTISRRQHVDRICVPADKFLVMTNH